MTFLENVMQKRQKKKKKKVEMTTCATVRTKLKYTLEKYALSLKPLV